MQDEFRNFVIGAIVISLFAFLIISASISLGNTYGKDVSGDEWGQLNLSGIEQTLEDVNESTAEFKDKFVDQKFSAITGVIAIAQIFQLFKMMWAVITTPIVLVSQIAVNVLHIPPLVIAVVMFIMIVGIIFAIWSLIKKGD